MAESGGGEARGRRRSIPVVYYLSRNRHLEHPHFIEVPLSSSSEAFLLRGERHYLSINRSVPF